MISNTPVVILALAMLSGLPSLQAGKGTPLPEKESAALKAQRDLADAFMRRATEAALLNLDKAGKDLKDRKEIAAYLTKQLDRKRYFDSSTDSSDLVEFKRLLTEADAVKIKLSDAAVQLLVKAAVMQQVDEKGLKTIEEEVRKKHSDASSQTLNDALASEFRVRIVRELNAKKK